MQLTEWASFPSPGGQGDPRVCSAARIEELVADRQFRFRKNEQTMPREVRSFFGMWRGFDDRRTNAIVHRFKNQLNPSIRNGPWTAEEERIIVRAQVTSRSFASQIGQCSREPLRCSCTQLIPHHARPSALTCSRLCPRLRPLERSGDGERVSRRAMKPHFLRWQECYGNQWTRIAKLLPGR
jgi:hypothetical protein